METIEQQRTIIAALKKKIDDLKNEVQQLKIERNTDGTAYDRLCAFPITCIKGMAKVKLFLTAQVGKKIGPKCSKCDEHRQLHFISPRGREYTEPCECSEAVTPIFDVIPVKLRTIHHSGDKLTFAFMAVHGSFPGNEEYLSKYFPNVVVTMPKMNASITLYEDEDAFISPMADVLLVIQNIYHGQDFKKLPLDDYTLFEKKEDAVAYKKYLYRHYRSNKS